ncbi:MAG: histidine--tRNA ligase [Saprospiraceae bacterium]|nr:histidine--tRNA ligase [Saprospiraceae bacterium]
MKVSLPKGTRDFLPAQSRKRKYLFSRIEQVFQRFGYVPIETPVLENLSTLMGKYGDEGDNLLFKVLNNGDFLAKADEQALIERNSNRVLPDIAKRGLRYDLTVPFARFVVMHQNEIYFPFKRYQIQPVWRADRPQRGRYQEFYQCDVDVVGSESLMYEAELIQIYDTVFHDLGIPVEIRVNNRKLLAGLAEAAGVPGKMMEMTVAIDKLDKIGRNGVLEEMVRKGIPEGNALQILNDIDLAWNELEDRLLTSQSGTLGVSELKQVWNYLDAITLHNPVVRDVRLARGLNYYTGCIFEITLATDKVQMGSLGGGGRYAELTGVFGMNDMPGVGISFGAERIYDVMDELELWPKDLDRQLDILILAMDEACLQAAFPLVSSLRAAGLRADLYPQPDKFKKQMKYADAVGTPWVAIMGPEELEDNQVTLKNMATGEQQRVSIREIPDKIH